MAEFCQRFRLFSSSDSVNQTYEVVSFIHVSICTQYERLFFIPKLSKQMGQRASCTRPTLYATEKGNCSFRAMPDKKASAGCLSEHRNFIFVSSKNENAKI